MKKIIGALLGLIFLWGCEDIDGLDTQFELETEKTFAIDDDSSTAEVIDESDTSAILENAEELPARVNTDDTDIVEIASGEDEEITFPNQTDALELQYNCTPIGGCGAWKIYTPAENYRRCYLLDYFCKTTRWCECKDFSPGSKIHRCACP